MCQCREPPSFPCIMGAPKCTPVVVSSYCCNMRQEECIFCVCLGHISLPSGERKHCFLVVIGKAMAKLASKGMSERLFTLVNFQHCLHAAVAQLTNLSIFVSSRLADDCCNTVNLVVPCPHRPSSPPLRHARHGPLPRPSLIPSRVSSPLSNAFSPLPPLSVP